MRLTTLGLSFFAVISLVGCATSPSESEPVRGSGRSSGGGDFVGAAGVDSFLRRMEKHGMSRQETAAILARAERRDRIIELMDRQAPRRSSGPNGAWTRYRGKFLTGKSISNGVDFWRRHAAALNRAEARYGVPPEYIVAILGVETRYGTYVGKVRLLDALATLSFAYPRRASYFSNELEDFLVLTKREGIDPGEPRGSFAGAMGICQFMPSSYRKYAVDFSGDGHRNLWNPEDAIGSVANYFAESGWQPGERVAIRAAVAPGSRAASLDSGFKTSYSMSRLADAGITPASARWSSSPVSLLKLDAAGGYEYWMGFKNFYVITRYNHSTYYAMAVHQLAQAMRDRMGGSPGVRVSSNW